MTGAFVVGAVAGAVALVPLVVLAQALASPLSRELRLGMWIAAVIAIAAANIVTRGCPLPQTRRQIGAALIASRDRNGAFLFGGALGTGLMTYVPSCTPHVLLCSLVLVQPSAFATFAAACGFGLGRAFAVVGRALASDRARFERRFQRMVTVIAGGAGSVIVGALVALGAWR